MNSITFPNLINHLREHTPTLYILCGLPYSSKTYITDAIQHAVDIDLVRIDDIFAQHGYDWNTDNLPDADEWDTIFSQAHAEVLTSLSAGRSIMFDSTNHMHVARQTLHDLAHTAGYPSRVIYIPISSETLWQRYHANIENPTRSIIPEHLVQMTIDTLEIPINKEGYEIVSD
jgi:predicted kinase